MESPLALWQVLTEELDQLRPASAKASDASGATKREITASLYDYGPHEIVDTDLLTRHLELRLPELKSLVEKKTPSDNKAADPTAVMGLLQSPQPDAQFLNALLRVPNLYRAFPAL